MPAEAAAVIEVIAEPGVLAAAVRAHLILMTLRMDKSIPAAAAEVLVAQAKVRPQTQWEIQVQAAPAS